MSVVFQVASKVGLKVGQFANMSVSMYVNLQVLQFGFFEGLHQLGFFEDYYQLGLLEGCHQLGFFEGRHQLA